MAVVVEESVAAVVMKMSKTDIMNTPMPKMVLMVLMTLMVITMAVSVIVI